MRKTDFESQCNPISVIINSVEILIWFQSNYTNEVLTRMNEEVDFSAIETNEYFVDKKCKELCSLLEKNPEFSEYIVKRIRWSKDWRFDPYIIQDGDEDDLFFLEPEIVDTLSDSELLSFIGVEMKYIDSVQVGFGLTIAVFILIPAAILNSIFSLFRFSNLLGTAVALLLLDVPVLLLGIFYYRKRNRMIEERRQIDLTEAKENSAFISALQKLVTIPDLDRVMEFKRRLRYIERTLEGVTS